MNQIKTQWVGREKSLPKVKTPARYVNPDSLKISNDPLPAARATPDHKYNETFSKLKPGQCLICEGNDAAKIGHALNVWLKKLGREGAVNTTKNYETDGKGRVWLVQPEKKLKAVAA